MQSSRNNLTELAARLDLAPSTVSRVLAGKGTAYRIARATQERVLAAARDSGIMVNQIARGLRTQQTHTLGVVVPDIANPFFAGLAREIVRGAREHGYSIVLADSQERADIEVDSVMLMRGREVDGLIVAPVGDSTAHLEAASRSGKPLVLVDRALRGTDIPTVVADNHGGGLLAVQHLAAHGHRHIACLQGAAGNEANRERVRGYREGLKALGIDFQDAQIVGSAYSVEGGHEAAIQALQLRPRPTGLVVLGSLIALGAMSALRESGLRVPEDISLVSYDEHPWAAVLSPALTTIAQPVTEMGRRALGLLLDASEPLHGQTRLILPVSLISRQSVGMPNATV